MHNPSFLKTHCDLWDVLFSLVRHVRFFFSPSSLVVPKSCPLCADAVAALAWMEASGNGRPSVSAM